MPHLTLPIGPSGPIVEVFIAIPEALEKALRAQGQPVPAPVKITALVDTGASASTITSPAAQTLGLQPTGKIPVSTPTDSNVMLYEYSVRIVIPGCFVVSANVICSELKGQNIDSLIGRDVLKHAVMTYNGQAGIFSVSF